MANNEKPMEDILYCSIIEIVHQGMISREIVLVGLHRAQDGKMCLIYTIVDCARELLRFSGLVISEDNCNLRDSEE